MNTNWIIFFLFSVFYSLDIDAQNLPSWAYNYLFKDIITYEIINGYEENNPDKLSVPFPFYYDIIPDTNCTLNYTLTKLNISYPKANCILYDCTFNLYNNLCGKYMEETSISDNTLKKEYSERKIIIAIDTFTKQIIKVSGKVFLTDLSLDFNSFKTDKDIEDYLGFRLLSLQLGAIKNKKDSKEILSFESFSKYYNSNIKIVFDKKKNTYTIR